MRYRIIKMESTNIEYSQDEIARPLVIEWRTKYESS